MHLCANLPPYRIGPMICNGKWRTCSHRPTQKKIHRLEEIVAGDASERKNVAHPFSSQLTILFSVFVSFLFLLRVLPG